MLSRHLDVGDDPSRDEQQAAKLMVRVPAKRLSDQRLELAQPCSWREHDARAAAYRGRQLALAAPYVDRARPMRELGLLLLGREDERLHPSLSDHELTATAYHERAAARSHHRLGAFICLQVLGIRHLRHGLCRAVTEDVHTLGLGAHHDGLDHGRAIRTGRAHVLDVLRVRPAVRRGHRGGIHPGVLRQVVLRQVYARQR